MKKTFTVLLLTLFVAVTFAQRPQGIIMQAEEPPVINGELDDVWEAAVVFDIDKPYRTEVPTIGEPGESTWRMLWDNDGVYIFLVVNDDDWYPSYMVAGSNNWEYDKPELYFDVNFILENGLGASAGGGSGHHQVAPAAAEATIDGTAVTETNGVVYAFKVDNPAYTVEYFIPWSVLTNSDGGLFDKSATMGFDVTIIDRDQGDDARRRMVWANTGDKDESWSNMDDVGYITFDGADAAVYIDKITLVGGEITENGGTLQIQAVIEPEDATNKSLSWSVENKTGRATINNTGLLTAVLDGVVTVRAEATDGSYEIAEVDVTISNQVPDMWSLNLIRNPFFEQIREDGGPAEWGGWIDGGYGEPHAVVENVAVLAVTLAHETEVWHYQFNQERLTAMPDIPYLFQFKAWSDVNRDITVDFEDTASNGYNRYGSSPDPESNGRSEWTFPINMEPTWYKFNVTFDEILPTTIQKVQYMISQAVGTVYLDSILLISAADMELVPTSIPAVDLNTFNVYPNPANDYLNVVLTKPNQTVAIFNTLGVKVDEVKVGGNMHTFNVSALPRGMYFIRAENSVVKFIKR